MAQENGLQIPSDKWHVLCEQGDADGDKYVIGTAYTCRLLTQQQQGVRETWVRHAARKGQGKVYKLLLGKSEEKRSFARPKRKVEYNIKLDVM